MGRKVKKGISVLYAIIGLCCVLTMHGLPVSASLSETDTVRVGYFDLNGFFMKDFDGSVLGYCVDYLDKIQEYTNLRFEFVETSDWNDAVAQLEAGKIDLLAPCQLTPQGLEKYAYCSFPIGVEYSCLLALKDRSDLIYEDFDSFCNVVIGCGIDSMYLENVKELAQKQGFTPTFQCFNGNEELLDALYNETVDIIASSSMSASEDIKMLAKFSPASFYFVSMPNKIKLIEQINHGLEQIEINAPQLQKQLTKKYFPLYEQTALTKSEMDYVEHANTLTIGCPIGRDPLIYYNEQSDEIDGVAIDILREIAAWTGLQFRYVPLPNDMVIDYQYLQEQKIDLIAGVEYTSVNTSLAGLSLSDPYLNMQKVFVSQNNRIFSFNNPMTIALLKGSATLSQTVSQLYPNFTFRFYNSMDECMTAVKKGKVDALLQNQYTVVPYLAKPEYENLTTVPVQAMDESMCLAAVTSPNGDSSDSIVRDERLLSTINKAISQLQQDKIAQIIIQQTTNRQYRYNFFDFVYRYQYAIGITGIVLIIGAGVLVYALRLRRKNMRLIRENEQTLRHITNNINGGVLVLLPHVGFKISYANEGFLHLIGVTRQEYMQRDNHYIAFVHSDDVPLLNQILYNKRQSSQISLELRVRNKNGAYIPTLFKGTIVQREDGQTELYCVIMDITEQKSMIEQLEFEQKRSELLVSKSKDLVFDFDLLNKKMTVSDRFFDQFGWNMPESFSWEDLAEHWWIYEEDKEKLSQMVQKILQPHHEDEFCQIRMMTKQGESVWCLISLHRFSVGNWQYHIIGKITDIDESVKEKEMLVVQAQTDALTGLYHKTAFLNKVGEYLGKYPNEPCALIFIDLDNFKNVNDLLGHIAGDQAILDAAKKLQGIFSNLDLISRFGGDEFCIFVKNIPQDTLTKKLEWVVAKMRHTYQDQTHQVLITSSVGAEYATGAQSNAEQMLTHADQALYRAKEDGKDQYAIYDSRIELKGYYGRSHES